MGLFGGDSSSSSSTNNFDKRVVTENGQAVSGDSNSISVTTNTIDPGGVKLAASALSSNSDITKAVTQAVADVAKTTTYDALLSAYYKDQNSLQASKDALAFANLQASNASATASGAVKDSLSAITLTSDKAIGAIGLANQQVLQASNANLHDALAAGVNATNSALTSNGQVIKDALAATYGTANTAMGIVSSANNTSLAFADKTIANSYALVDKSQGMVFESGAQALGFGSHIVDMAFQSADLSLQGSANAVNQVARAYDTATNYQAEKATTDSRYLVIAGMVVVAIMALKVMGGK